MMKLDIFRASKLIVDPVMLRHASGLRLERNFHCGRGDCAPIRCTHRRGWHLFLFGFVVIFQ